MNDLQTAVEMTPAEIDYVSGGVLALVTPPGGGPATANLLNFVPTPVGVAQGGVTAVTDLKTGTVAVGVDVQQALGLFYSPVTDNPAARALFGIN